MKVYFKKVLADNVPPIVDLRDYDSPVEVAVNAKGDLSIKIHFLLEDGLVRRDLFPGDVVEDLDGVLYALTTRGWAKVTTQSTITSVLNDGDYY